MSRVITFSRTFPAYHPKAGQPTNFIQKIWKGLPSVPAIYYTPFIDEDITKSIIWDYQLVEGVKHHTIRAGNRWKAGDKFSPRVWSGKPYNSKMITIAPDIEIKKVWDIEIKKTAFKHNSFVIWKQILPLYKEEELAKNDGLELCDMLSWFKAHDHQECNFSGQIICWNDKIEY